MGEAEDCHAEADDLSGWQEADRGGTQSTGARVKRAG